MARLEAMGAVCAAIVFIDVGLLRTDALADVRRARHTFAAAGLLSTALVRALGSLLLVQFLLALLELRRQRLGPQSWHRFVAALSAGYCAAHAYAIVTLYAPFMEFIGACDCSRDFPGSVW